MLGEDGKVTFYKDPNKKSTSNVDETLKCPKCGKPIQKNAKAWGCSGWKDGCKLLVLQLQVFHIKDIYKEFPSFFQDLKYKWGWACSAYSKDDPSACKFAMGYNMGGATFTDKDIEEILYFLINEPHLGHFISVKPSASFGISSLGESSSIILHHSLVKLLMMKN